MIRKAEKRDLDEIMEIVKETVKVMNESGNFQWDENYPLRENFESDIDKEDLYVYCSSEGILGFVCINESEADEYSKLNWTLSTKAVVVHRIAISIKGRRKGIAGKFIDFAEKIALDNNIKIIKTDTNVVNSVAISLFKKHGFSEIGIVALKSRPGSFVCLEKVL